MRGYGWSLSRPSHNSRVLEIKQIDFVVIDLETSGLKPGHNEVLSLGAKAYSGQTLEPYPDGEFYSLLRPTHWDRLEPEAMRINGLGEEELRGAPEPKVVLKKFVEWVQKWNPTKRIYEAPTVCGKNIRNFDLKFLAVLLDEHYPKKKPALFNTLVQTDLEDLLRLWFPPGLAPFNSYKMDEIRPYFGIPVHPTHNALVDCREEGALIMTFLKATRQLRKLKNSKGELILNFEGCCRGKC